MAPTALASALRALLAAAGTCLLVAAGALSARPCMPWHDPACAGALQQHGCRQLVAAGAPRLVHCVPVPCLPWHGPTCVTALTSALRALLIAAGLAGRWRGAGALSSALARRAV